MLAYFDVMVLHDHPVLILAAMILAMAVLVPWVRIGALLRRND